MSGAMHVNRVLIATEEIGANGGVAVLAHGLARYTSNPANGTYIG